MERDALEQALRLLLDPKAADLHERHAAAIARAARRAASAGGCAVADAARLAALLEVSLRAGAAATTAAASESVRAAFAGPLCELLHLLRLPLLRCCVSDELRLPAALSDVLRVVALALSLDGVPVSVVGAAADAVEAIASAYGGRPSVVDLLASRGAATAEAGDGCDEPPAASGTGLLRDEAPPAAAEQRLFGLHQR